MLLKDSLGRMSSLADGLHSKLRKCTIFYVDRKKLKKWELSTKWCKQKNLTRFNKRLKQSIKKSRQEQKTAMDTMTQIVDIERY